MNRWNDNNNSTEKDGMEDMFEGGIYGNHQQAESNKWKMKSKTWTVTQETGKKAGKRQKKQSAIIEPQLNNEWGINQRNKKRKTEENNQAVILLREWRKRGPWSCDPVFDRV